jgi:beta-1,4-N-acetylglucosaminyltransferase
MLEDYKILVTVGTTAFDGLIKFLDTSYNWPNALFQIGPGSYIPTRHKYSRFIDNLESEYDQYDLVLCHAGAGTIYHCLERGLKILVVPNLQRQDTHQIEIAKYLIKNNYALVAENFIDFDSVLQKVENYKANPYFREQFNAREFILDQISKAL